MSRGRYICNRRKTRCEMGSKDDERKQAKGGDVQSEESMIALGPGFRTSKTMGIMRMQTRRTGREEA